MPLDHQYTRKELALHNKMLKIAQKVQAGMEIRISLLAQGWRNRQKPEAIQKKRR